MKPNPKNEVLIGNTHKDKNIALGEHTTTINTILNNKNVSRRPAVLGEKKTILQAVMGTIIVHGDDLTYHLIDHKLSETDEFYKHFAILQFTQSFTKTCLDQINSKNTLDSISDSLYQDLYDYSGLSHKQMISWFTEMYAAHTSVILLKRTENSDKPSVHSHLPPKTHLLQISKKEQEEESEKRQKKNKQKEKPQQKPTTVLSSTSDWIKFWKLKNGISIYHYPGYVELTDNPFIDMWDVDIEMDHYNARGVIFSIHVSTDMTEAEFITALRNDGNLD
jgi:hypothetical protein